MTNQKILPKNKLKNLKGNSSAGGNSTYKKLEVQWLIAPDSYRDCGYQKFVYSN